MLSALVDKFPKSFEIFPSLSTAVAMSIWFRLKDIRKIGASKKGKTYVDFL